MKLVDELYHSSAAAPRQHWLELNWINRGEQRTGTIAAVFIQGLKDRLLSPANQCTEVETKGAVKQCGKTWSSHGGVRVLSRAGGGAARNGTQYFRNADLVLLPRRVRKQAAGAVLNRHAAADPHHYCAGRLAR